MKVVAGIMVCAAVGAAARYGLDGFISSRASPGFPWGIFVVNITGSFLLGLLYTLMTGRLAVDATYRVWITTGLVGGYTTFSTLSFETVQLLQAGSYGSALANSAGSLVTGVGAAALGMALGTAL